MHFILHMNTIMKLLMRPMMCSNNCVELHAPCSAHAQAPAEAAREVKFTVDHLYHQQDLIHVFHVVPDIKTVRGAKKLDPNDVRSELLLIYCMHPVCEAQCHCQWPNVLPVQG